MPNGIHNRRLGDYCIGKFELQILENVMKCDFESNAVLKLGIYRIVGGGVG
jgi:hypothetical protein